MKKSIIMVIGILGMMFSSIASIDDSVFVVGSPSTNTIDTYSDGSKVEDGEKYALVWTRDGSEFQGFNSDGTISGTDSKLIAFLPAKNGRLMTTLIQIDVNSPYNCDNGSYSVHLLDTRGGDIVKRYSTLAIGYKNNGQFERMAMENSNLDSFVSANGYVEEIEDIVVPAEDQEPFEDEIVQDDPIWKIEPVDSIYDEETETTFRGEYIPLKFTKNLIRTKWLSMYRKHESEEIYPIFKKHYTKMATYDKKTWIIKYDIYGLVPESYVELALTKKSYINRFSEKRVITHIYVVDKTEAIAYEIRPESEMWEVDRIEFQRKDRSKVIKMLRKLVIEEV